MNEKNETGMGEVIQIDEARIRDHLGEMLRFRRMRSLQKFAAAHASVFSHFNSDLHLNKQENFKQSRSAALDEWRQLGGA